MILDSAVDQLDFQALILSTQHCNWLSRLPLSGFTYSLYSKPKTAYHLPAKHHHRITMESFLGGVLDIFGLTLMRIPQRDPEL